MRLMTKRGAGVLALFAAVGLLAAGCGDGANKSGQVKDKAPGKGAVQVAEGKKDAHQHDHGKEEKKGHDHTGWWCDDHGVPEGECSMCNAKVAAEFKKKGDWCKEHDRAESQCFICNPKQKELYAAKHQAKYGKAPPATEDDKKKDDKSKKDEKK